jgi:GNAT superfamily N-acetyltransferase
MVEIMRNNPKLVIKRTIFLVLAILLLTIMSCHRLAPQLVQSQENDTNKNAQGIIISDVPLNAEPNADYLFFLRAKIVEDQGIHPTSPKYGVYEAALPKWSEGIAEMKRLYVQPRKRGMGIGKLLVEKVINQAKMIGYLQIRLDTIPGMDNAQALYRMIGFKEIPPYRYNANSGMEGATVSPFAGRKTNLPFHRQRSNIFVKIRRAAAR